MTREGKQRAGEKEERTDQGQENMYKWKRQEKEK